VVGTSRIRPEIKKEAEKRPAREVETGVTPRSSEPLDFTTFGELCEIIKDNIGWLGEPSAGAVRTRRRKRLGQNASGAQIRA
jgi:hypothetical protein